MSSLQRFHLALPCAKLVETKMFYVDVIGAALGRYSQNWIDINLFGHQLTFTEAGDFDFNYKNYRFNNEVLPSFHFGIIVDVDTWGKTYSRLLTENIDTTTKVTYLKDKVGEHLSFFITDPNGYKVEFKSFKDDLEIFST